VKNGGIKKKRAKCVGCSERVFGLSEVMKTEVIKMMMMEDNTSRCTQFSI
jgi:hypothetical protein